MDVRALVDRLGGASVVAEAVGETVKTVSMWGTRNAVPAARYIVMWKLARDAGLAWTPPGGEGLALVPREAA